MKEKYRKIDCIMEKITEKAFLINVESEPFWIPRSCCMNGHKEFVEENVTLYIAEWLCDKHEL